jgi:F-type H+-transporting ATPase subunit gamma
LASLKEIRSRIVSVKNTAKITRAMRMVSAAKLRRAQRAIQATRPYALKLMGILHDLALRASPDDHPLLARRVPRRSLLIVVTSDRGLCGAFNANITRRAEAFLRDEADRYQDLAVGLIGRKGSDHFRRRKANIRKDFQGVFAGGITFEDAISIGDWIVNEYVAEDLDEVHLVYNEFKSAISQRVVVEKILPIDPASMEEAGGTETDFLYEPDKKSLLKDLLPLYVNYEIFRVLLESWASEHGARMTAMENASTNAGELIESLTLQYNKARQASITGEILEIVSGAEALKG